MTKKKVMSEPNEVGPQSEWHTRVEEYDVVSWESLVAMTKEQEPLTARQRNSHRTRRNISAKPPDSALCELTHRGIERSRK